MKNKILKYSFLTTLIMICSCCFIKNVNPIYADTNLQMVIVEGTGKAEFTADCAIIRFNISAISEDFDKGQNTINNTFEEISKGAKEINPENLAYITYTSCYPIYNDSLKTYEFSCGVNVKTKQIDSVNNIIQMISTKGEICYYGTDYSIEDEKELYQSALNNAKQDAISKANALSENLELKAIIGTQVYTNNYEKNGKVIIEATIKCIFATKDHPTTLPEPEQVKTHI